MARAAPNGHRESAPDRFRTQPGRPDFFLSLLFSLFSGRAGPPRPGARPFQGGLKPIAAAPMV